MSLYRSVRRFSLRSVPAVVLSAAIAAPLAAQAGWLPAGAQEAASKELAARLGSIDIGRPVAEEARLKSARLGVDTVIQRLDTWGPEQVLEKAPSFPDLGLPPTDNTYLAAMGRYGLCTLPMEAQFADTSQTEEGPDARITGAFGSIAVALVTGYLRHHYLADGGDDEAIRAYLAGQSLNTVAGQISADGDLMAAVRNRCAPVVSELLTGQSRLPPTQR